jgi:hypothetical protein
MAQNESSKATATNESLKPGSSAEDARKVGGEGDFGASAGQDRPAERDYVSRNTKVSDPGASQAFDWEEDGVRDHGAGGRSSGPGSASGGDLDPDIVGVGTGGSGIAVSGNVGRPAGPDDSDGTSDEFAAGGHAEGREPDSTRIQGTTHFADADVSTGGDPQGADAATNPRRGDDAFAGEISSGEAQGQDNPLSPSSDDQG